MCGKNSVINDDDALRVFERCVSDARHFAVLCFKGTSLGEVAVFRFPDQAFHYFQHHSRHHRQSVAAALGRFVGDKRVFVLDKTATNNFFRTEFKWVPRDAVDATDSARSLEGVNPAISSFAHYLTGGKYCRRRARNFADFTIPSPAQPRDSTAMSMRPSFTNSALRC